MELKKIIDGLEYTLVPISEKENLDKEAHRLKEIAIIESKLYTSMCTTMRLGKKLKEMIENVKPNNPSS